MAETAAFGPGQRVFTLQAGGGDTVDLAAAVGVRVPTTVDLGVHEADATGEVGVTAAGVVKNAVVAGTRDVPAPALAEPEQPDEHQPEGPTGRGPDLSVGSRRRFPGTAVGPST